MLSLSPSRLFTGDAILEGATVQVDNGRITAITTTPVAGATKLDGLLAPGLIDIQVNGGGGVLFNDAPTPETLATIAAAHSQFGVTGFLATLITDERAKTAQAIEAVSQAIASGVPGLLGLHLEGPWLSEPRRGVHPARHLRAFELADLQLIAQKRPFPVLLTVAPEQIDTASIRTLRNAGVIVSIGHTAATSDEVDAAIAAGATGFTHLFNAMPPLEGRNPGAVGAALADPNVWAGLILDGIHVHPTSARAALAAKTSAKLILVSDAMSTIGSKEPSMFLFGEKISVQDGALRTATGTLAGAHLELSGAVRNAVALLGAPQADALRMATATPTEFISAQDRGRIAQGARADFVLLDSTLRPKATWIGGVQVN